MLRSNTLSLSLSELVLLWTLRAFALISGLITLLIFLFLILESAPIIKSIGVGPFYNDPSWNPVSKLYNMTPMLWGSIFATVGCLLLAGPLGVITAIFCLYYAPKSLALMVKKIIEVAAGIPSVVYGFWGLVVVVPLIGEYQPPGASLLAGILILSLMVLPTMFLSAESALASLPKSLHLSSEALGITRSTKVFRVLIPAAGPSLLTGLILQAGRAIGETMALLMVCGNVVQTPKSIFEPMRTLTTNIALEMAYATGSHRSALFVSGLLLMIFIGILIGAANGLSHAER